MGLFMMDTPLRFWQLKGPVMDHATNIAFGQRIRVALAVANKRQADLARECGVTPQAVKRWCAGETYPTSGNLIALCRFTGCSMEWVMWPHPIDVKSTEYAPGGIHVKNLVRAVMDELATETI
jgi:transcriptional regulator with XRE-family HTH domain